MTRNAEPRVRPRTSFALPSAFLTAMTLSGCLVPHHDSFATPEDTVLTFQSAFARDDEFKEYDCFAVAMKRQHGLDQQKWSLARGEILKPLGSLGEFVLRRNSLEDNLVGGTRGAKTTKLAYSMFGTELEVELEPEAVLVFPGTEPGTERAWTVDERAAFVDDGSDLVVVIETSRELASTWTTEGVPWVELRHHWKVLSIAALAEDAPAPSPLPSVEPERVQTLKVGRIVPMRLRESLGVVRLRFELPLVDHSGPGCLLIWPPRPELFDRYRWEAEPLASP